MYLKWLLNLLCIIHECIIRKADGIPRYTPALYRYLQIDSDRNHGPHRARAYDQDGENEEHEEEEETITDGDTIALRTLAHREDGRPDLLWRAEPEKHRRVALIDKRDKTDGRQHEE